MSEKHWTYVVTPPARRDLRRLDRPIKQRIVDALDHFVANPHTGDTRKLTNSDEWRLRVGDWRVRFNFDDEAPSLSSHASCHAAGPTTADRDLRACSVI